ncbi:MAG: T9SS type A sorting domain-containing protein [Calditrichaeota bacterium]|nr:T9SS type A sorting domain-containing protein [Calditrichota bacterium]
MFRVYGDDLFVNDNDYHNRHIIHHYNIEDRSNPRLIESIPVFSEYENTWSYLTSFHVEDEFVYFIRHLTYSFRLEYYEYSEFVIVNIADSDNPQVVSETNIGDHGMASEYIFTLVDFQNHIAFISSNGVLKVYSTWNREWPRHVATFSGVNRFESMSILNNYIFVSDYNELLSFDSAGLLSAPYAPPPPLPTAISLSAYPNPFNASVTVSFDLPRSMPVSLQVFDLSGRLVETLVENTEYSGKQSIVWNTRDIVSGVYMLKLETTEGNSKFQRVTLVK